MHKILFTLVAVVLLGCFFFSNNINIQKSESPTDQFDNLRPADEYLLRRNYPAGDEGQESYKLALTKAKYFDKKYRNKNTSWRQEGPYNIGGRINTIAVDPTNASIIYVGTPAAGIFKTTNGGTTWTQQFNQEKTLTIGELIIDPHNNNTLYAGTGDKALSSFTYLGDGLYKSTDAGQTWNNLGLGKTGIINKIIVHPNDPNTIYAGTMGNIYSIDTNRGLYKTTNGGTTWNKILFPGTTAGIGDVIMHPTHPDTLYVTTRTRIRTNAISTTTGPALVLRSYDGGANWQNMNTGLPSGNQCKISIAQSQSAPNILYAVYCDTSMNYGGTYKSNNGGDNWVLQNSASSIVNFGGFGWYFGEVRVDPTNPNTIYTMGIDLYKSTNSGSSWFLGTPQWSSYEVHADKHDLQFIGNSGSSFLLATDGGIYETNSGGGANASNWTNHTNMPITQFYEAGYYPFDTASYFGGAQDNGTQFGSASGGLNNWIRFFGGDGFRPAFDPTDSNAMYVETQNGNIFGTDDGFQSIQLTSGSLVATDRTNWNTPYILSHSNSKEMYAGTYRVHKNNFLPYDSWTPISTDLTDGINNQNHTITTIDQSSINHLVLYAGTSDANIWVTKNEGTNWTKIDAGMPNRNVSSIKASPNNVSNVFVSYWGYRSNDTTAYIYFSSDYGNNWTSIASNDLPNFAINDIWIRPDGKDSSIVIANDGGVYSTVNRGASWSRVGNNMPIIPVYDLEINKAQNRIIAATFAMSMQTIEIDSAFTTTKPIVNVSTNNLLQNKFRLYPNPTSSYFKIKFEHDFYGAVNIYTLLGKKIISKQLAGTQSQLDISQFSKGTYFVILESVTGERLVRKITKK